MRCRRTESLRRVWLLTNAATKPPGCSVVHFWFIYLRYVLTLNRGTRDRNRAMFSAETVCEFNMVSAAACNTAYVDTVGFAEYCLLQYWPGRAVLCPIDRSVSKCTMNIYSQLYGVYFLTQWYFSEMLLSFIKIPCVYVAFHSLSEIFWQKKRHKFDNELQLCSWVASCQRFKPRVRALLTSARSTRVSAAESTSPSRHSWAVWACGWLPTMIDNPTIYCITSQTRGGVSASYGAWHDSKASGHMYSHALVVPVPRRKFVRSTCGPAVA